MTKLLIASVLAAITSNASAQQAECIIDEKPHYYIATGTVKTGSTGALRTFGLVSPAHKDLAACDEGLEHLRAQFRIAPKNGIAAQSVAYEGYCVTTEICP